MQIGTVTGNVWSTKRIEGMPHAALLRVELESGGCLIAVDVIGSGVGEQVIITQGSVAAAWFDGASPPVDALIVGSIDPTSG